MGSPTLNSPIFQRRQHMLSGYSDTARNLPLTGSFKVYDYSYPYQPRKIGQRPAKFVYSATYYLCKI